MKISTLIAMSLLAILALKARALPVNNLPMEEEQVEKRSAVNDAGDEYIRKLYETLSRDELVDPIAAQTNTIRSLKNTAKLEDGCNVFKFNLSNVFPSELVTNAQLSLQMTIQPSSSEDPYFITVQRWNNGEFDSNYIASLELQATSSEKRIEFQLQAEIATYIKNGESSAVFKVQVYGNRHEYRPDTKSAYICNDQFSFQDSYLALHTFDGRINQIDYQSMLSKVPPDGTTTNSVQRKKRNLNIQVEGAPTCQVNELHVPVKEIPVSATHGEGKIVLPVDTFNAGICGGVCGNGLPQFTPLRHSRVVHFMVSSPDFQKPVINGLTTVFFQCCAPVMYRTIVVMFEPVGQGSIILRIPNMRISKCDCLEVMSFKGPKSNPSR